MSGAPRFPADGRGFLMYYVLDDDGEPLAVDDAIAWGVWYETADRTVARTVIGDVRVSTVFLAIDHAYLMGPPVLWETMIFGGRRDGYQTRYTTRSAAVAGHAAAVERVERDQAAAPPARRPPGRRSPTPRRR